MTVPYDLEVAFKYPNWQDSVSWPNSLDAMTSSGTDILKKLIGLIRDTDDPELGDLLMLAAVRAFSDSLKLVDMALALDAKTTTFECSYPEFDYLRGEITLEALPQRTLIPPTPKVPKIFLRRLKRTAIWNPYHKIIKAMFRPDVTIVAENSLMKSHAAHNPQVFGVHHIEALYNDISDYRRPLASTDLADTAAELLTDELSVATTNDPAIGVRLHQLIFSITRRICRLACSEIAASRQIPKLPDNIWAGSGSRWPQRVVSLEVIRRGGKIRRFDHGGPTGLNVYPAMAALNDLMVATTFTMASPALADQLKSQNVLDMLPARRKVEIDGTNGDAEHKHLVRHTLRRPNTSHKPRVLYVSGLYRGFRQIIPAQFLDTLYLDWNIRLIKTLQTLDIELICRPHPEGIFQGKEHPLAKVTPVSKRSFEELIPEVDVFIMDQARSTTFFNGMMTDRPLIFLDFGAPYFGPFAQSLIEQRCHIIKTSFDDRNRPIIDEKELEDAIFSHSSPIDLKPIRKMFLAA